MRWSTEVRRRTIGALSPLADQHRALPMAAYMKDVAPFLGISAAPRRKALIAAWSDLVLPSSAELGAAAEVLMALEYREYHYAAYDLIDRYRRVCDEYFLDRYVTELLTTKPWWDTVDGLATAAVSPLCREFDAQWLVEEWSESGDRWLIRAAITHQRGWKQETNFSVLFELCDRHWGDPEFFIAKAIGWALRDAARIDPAYVREFLSSRRRVNTVAEREIRRGLDSAKRRY
jgi:3-methyladenine DNA glycosylase AlkD